MCRQFEDIEEIQRLDERNRELSTENAKLRKKNEERKWKKEKLKNQNEELTRQNEELIRQNEELTRQNEEPTRQKKEEERNFFPQPMSPPLSSSPKLPLAEYFIHQQRIEEDTSVPFDEEENEERVVTRDGKRYRQCRFLGMNQMYWYSEHEHEDGQEEEYVCNDCRKIIDPLSKYRIQGEEGDKNMFYLCHPHPCGFKQEFFPNEYREEFPVDDDDF